MPMTLFIFALSLVGSTPVNAKTTLEERADNDWYFNFGAGLQQERGDKIRTGGLRNTITVGMRLSPTLAMEITMQGASTLFSDDTTLHLTGGINWAFLPNLALNGGLGTRSIKESDSSGLFDFSASCDETTEIRAKDWGAQIGLSSDWQWGGFTLGIEWISIYQPLLLDEVTEVTTFPCEDESPLTASTDITFSDLPISISFSTVKLGGSF